MNAKLLIKHFIKLLFKLATLPLYFFYLLMCLFGNPDVAFQSFSQVLSLIPGKVGIYIRAAFYHLACPDTSDEIYVGFLTVFSHRDTSIQKGVYIGPQCNIGKCIIRENTLVGSGVHILSGSQQHYCSDTSIPIQKQGGQYVKIDINEDCWLGNSSLIMVSLAPHCIVAAGSIVNKPAEPGDILAGNPARKIRNRLTREQLNKQHNITANHEQHI